MMDARSLKTPAAPVGCTARTSDFEARLSHLAWFSGHGVRRSRTRLAASVLAVTAVALPSFQPGTNNTNPAPPFQEGLREVHAVAIYEMAKGTNEVEVEIDRPGRSITVVLSSYDQATWKLLPTAETTIEKVILAGYSPQSLVNSKLEVVEKFRREDKSNSPFLYFGYQLDDPRARSAIPQLRRITGLELASFSSGYRPPEGRRFRVDRVAYDERLLASYPIVSTDELPEVKFRGCVFEGSPRGLHTGSFLTTFTLTGPTDLLKLSSDVRALAEGPEGALVGCTVHDLVRIDARTGTTTEIPLEVSWPQSVTYVAATDEYLVITRRGVLAFHPDRPNMKTLLDRRDIIALTDDPKTGRLFAVQKDHGHPANLYTMTRSGAVLTAAPLDLPGLEQQRGGNSLFAQLVASPQGLILWCTSSQHPLASGNEYIYRIDPENGETTLTYKQESGQ